LKTGEKMRDVFVKKKLLAHFLASRIIELEKTQKLEEQKLEEGSDIYFQGEITGQLTALREILDWVNK